MFGCCVSLCAHNDEMFLAMPVSLSPLFRKMRDEKKSRRISRRPFINRLGRNWLTNGKTADNMVEFCASENGKIILKRELRSSACAHFFLCEQRFHSRIRRRVTTSGPRTLIGARKTWHCIDYGYLYVFSSDDKSWIFYLIHRYIHNTHTHTWKGEEE